MAVACRSSHNPIVDSGQSPCHTTDCQESLSTHYAKRTRRTGNYARAILVRDANDTELGVPIVLWLH